ncbi:MAG: hydrolase [Planctomycetes bacterium]|nr:hydrolase [Planctomycetota bacterium]
MIDIEKCCLAVVDVQGKLAQLMDGKESLFANIEVLIKAAKALEIPILWCQQNPRALGPTVPQLAELLDGVEPVDKMSFSCCGDAGFIDKLNALKTADVILCGIEAHICVYQTAMDLLDRDLNVHLIADAVSSRTAANRQIAIQRLTAEGANLSSTEMILFELLKTAEHPEFKELCGLIK